MSSELGLHVLRWIVCLLLVGGTFALTLLFVGSPHGLPRLYWARYVALLESKLRRLYIWTSGATIAVCQIVGLFVCFTLHVLVDLPGHYAVLLAFLTAVGPILWIERMRSRRLLAIEDQTDAFVLAIANALKSTPSIGDAFKSVAIIVRDPLRQEIMTALKEIRFGASLDQALALMAARVGSPQLDTALSSILIGRQVGGNLPTILERTAASLREMKRLEGVVRTKTADGKTQMWVLALFPVVLVLGVSWLMPGYLDPLNASVIGIILTIVAVLLWGAAVLAARKILSVDI
jgi:tight adherence protein B